MGVKLPKFAVEVVPDTAEPGRFFVVKPLVFRIDRSVSIDELRDMAAGLAEAVEVCARVLP